MSVSLENLAQRFSFLVPKLMRMIHRYESNYLSEGVITMPQMLLMQILVENGKSTMSELADELSMSSSSATGLVDRLLKHELVTRIRSESDRRVVQVALTEKGEHILKEIDEQKRKGFLELFKPLSAEERTQYLTIIEKLVSAFAESPGTDSRTEKS